jgi:hypothetical protein
MSIISKKNKLFGFVEVNFRTESKVFIRIFVQRLNILSGTGIKAGDRVNFLHYKHTHMAES